METRYRESPTYGDRTLYDVLENRLEYGEVTEYMSLHVFPVGESAYGVVLDGYAQPYAHFDVDEMEDVLEVVATLNELFLEIDNLRENAPDELREQCGEWRGNGEDERIVYEVDEDGQELEVERIPEPS